MSRAAAIVARARGAIGSRFRLHGREPATGLDCVGLAAVAFGRAAVPTGYALRGGSADTIAALAAASGLTPAAVPAPGDLLLFAVGPGQLHLGVVTPDGIVHADAALRRVVERPGTPPWPLVGSWRDEGE